MFVFFLFCNFLVIRLHLAKFLKGYNADKYQKGFLDTSYRGLGHSYSRAKVKFNVNRDDNIIIQCICLLDQMDKDINTICMRLKFKFYFSSHLQGVVFLAFS